MDHAKYSAREAAKDSPLSATNSLSDGAPPGYKYTERGLIPNDWDVRALREGIELLSGHHVLAQHCNTRGDGVPYLTGPADFPDGKIEQTKFTDRPSTICETGDILVTVKGSGAGTLVKADGAYCISRQLMAIRTEEWESKFLFYSLLQNASQIKAASTGLIPGLSRSDILDQEIQLPKELTEQRAIAEVLSDVDGLLGALEALIAKKEAFKQAAMQQLLTGKTRLPGFNGKWETTAMGQIGSTYGGLSGKSKADFGGGDALYVTFLNVLENVILDTEQFESVRVESGEAQNHVLQGDLLFNGTSETPGDLAMGAVMGEQHDNLYLNSFCFGFRIHEQFEYVPLFLAYFFRAAPGRAIMYALAQGATRYNMSKSQFLALELSVPGFREQSGISTVLADMDTEIAALEQSRDKTKQIKQGMMQQLLTGRIRLVESVPEVNK